MDTIVLERVGSTNSWMQEKARELPHLAAVRSVEQIMGRGQRGNSWEAAAGKNITCTILLKLKAFRASWQFSISEGVALAVCDALATFGIEAEVKWPNDIYVADKKISGILIEHSVMGMELQHSIAGVGLNVNQRVFVSEAPNPVSMVNITGKEYDVDEVMEELRRQVAKRIDGMEEENVRAGLHEEFKSRLWRREGIYRWIDAEGEFEGRIMDVQRDGRIVMDRNGEERKYWFKELRFKELRIKGLRD